MSLRQENLVIPGSEATWESVRCVNGAFASGKSTGGSKPPPYGVEEGCLYDIAPGGSHFLCKMAASPVTKMPPYSQNQISASSIALTFARPLVMPSMQSSTPSYSKETNSS